MGRGRDRWRALFPRPAHAVLALVVCIVVPAALAVRQQSENRLPVFYDELAHWDYVVRLGDGELQRFGEPLLPSTNRESQCRDAEAAGGPVPDGCDRSTPPDAFGPFMYQYEAQQPPGYYLAVQPLRWLGTGTLGLDDLTASRLAGAVLLTVGLCVVWLTGRLLGIAPLLLAALVLLLGTSPDAVFMASFVSNDATALLAGALTLLAGVVAWRWPGTRSTVLGAAVGLLVLSLKASNLLAVGAVVLAVAGLAWSRTTGDAWGRLRSTSLRVLRVTGGLVAGALVAALFWTVLFRVRAVVDPAEMPVFESLRAVPVDGWRVLRSGLFMLNPLSGSALSDATLRTDAEAVPQALALAIVGAGALSGLFVERRSWPHWLGLAWIVTVVCGGAVLGLSMHLTFAIDPLLSARYGLCLAPLVVLAAGAALRGRASRVALYAVSVASATTTALVLLV